MTGAGRAPSAAPRLFAPGRAGALTPVGAGGGDWQLSPCRGLWQERGFLKSQAGSG